MLTVAWVVLVVDVQYGDSPMHYACFCGHVDAVQALINAGADPAKPSRDGKTPLESAKEEGHDEVVRLLSVSQGGNNKVAGLDFSSGVIIEGELRKKRANRVVKWRRKYYVLSQTYGAMFFWTGTRSHVEGVIKKVRFETFLSVRHHKNEKNGRRFDIRVVTGRTMELLASNESDAVRCRARLCGCVCVCVCVAVRVAVRPCSPPDVGAAGVAAALGFHDQGAPGRHHGRYSGASCLPHL